MPFRPPPDWAHEETTWPRRTPWPGSKVHSNFGCNGSVHHVRQTNTRPESASTGFKSAPLGGIWVARVHAAIRQPERLVDGRGGCSESECTLVRLIFSDQLCLPVLEHALRWAATSCHPQRSRLHERRRLSIARDASTLTGPHAKIL